MVRNFRQVVAETIEDVQAWQAEQTGWTAGKVNQCTGFAAGTVYQWADKPAKMETFSLLNTTGDA